MAGAVFDGEVDDDGDTGGDDSDDDDSNYGEASPLPAANPFGHGGGDAGGGGSQVTGHRSQVGSLLVQLVTELIDG